MAFNLQIIAYILGSFGGLYGLWNLIYNYVLPFKPIISVGSKSLFICEKIRENIYLDSIICYLEISNNRNKSGFINDFAIRIYQYNIINPDKADYFVTKYWSEMPVNVNNANTINKTLFSPKAFPPKVYNSIILEFSEILHRSKLIIDPKERYYLELYYQKKQNKKWYFITRLYPFLEKPKENLNIIDENENKIIFEYTHLNWKISRDKINKYIKKPKIPVYKGNISNYFLIKYLNILKYYILKYLICRIKDIYLLFNYNILKLLQLLYDLTIRSYIIRTKGYKTLKYDIKIGSPEKRPISIKALNNIYEIISNEVNLINKYTDEDKKINIEYRNREIIISRPKLSIKIYISGDTYIRVHETNNIHNSKINFHLSQKGILSFSFWILEYFGPISIKSFALKILDAFLFYSFI